MKAKCKDCFSEYEIDDDTKLYICGCGGLVFDRSEYNSHQVKLKTGRKDN